jgi:hypothetical protein
MKVQTRTLALLVVASGVLASGYLIGPAPGATTTTGTVVAQAVPLSSATLVPAPQPTSKIKMMRPPVPLQVGGHDQYFVTRPADVVATETQTAAATMGTTGTIGDKPLDDQGQANFAAKAAIEQDGYRNVRALVKSADGTWRGRAMRGSTEITVSVDASGSVSAD